MKIIAQTSKPQSYTKKFLVEMTDDELAKLAGFYSANSSKLPLTIGSEIHVNEVYSAMQKVVQEAGASNYSLQSKAKELRELADSLDLLKIRMSCESEILKNLQ